MSDDIPVAWRTLTPAEVAALVQIINRTAGIRCAAASASCHVANRDAHRRPNP